MSEQEYKMNVMRIGLKIGYYRRSAGMTQQELSDASGVSLVYIGQLEAPNTIYCPSVKVIFKLAEALGIKASKLLEVDE